MCLYTHVVLGERPQGRRYTVMAGVHRSRCLAFSWR